MSEQHVDYRDLTREKRLEVLDSLAKKAIDIVTRHPDILEPSMLDVLKSVHEYGYVGFLGLCRAIKQGKITPNYGQYNTTLRVPDKGAED